MLPFSPERISLSRKVTSVKFKVSSPMPSVTDFLKVAVVRETVLPPAPMVSVASKLAPLPVMRLAPPPRFIAPVTLETVSEAKVMTSLPLPPVMVLTRVTPSFRVMSNAELSRVRIALPSLPPPCTVRVVMRSSPSLRW